MAAGAGCSGRAGASGGPPGLGALGVQRCWRGTAFPCPHPGSGAVGQEEPMSLSAVPRRCVLNTERQAGAAGIPRTGSPSWPGPCPPDGATSPPQSPVAVLVARALPPGSLPGESPGLPPAPAPSLPQPRALLSGGRVRAGCGGRRGKAAPPPRCLSRPATNTGNSSGAGAKVGRASPCAHRHTDTHTHNHTRTARTMLAGLHTSPADNDLEKRFCTLWTHSTWSIPTPR